MAYHVNVSHVSENSIKTPKINHFPHNCPFNILPNLPRWTNLSNSSYEHTQQRLQNRAQRLVYYLCGRLEPEMEEEKAHQLYTHLQTYHVSAKSKKVQFTIEFLCFTLFCCCSPQHVWWYSFAAARVDPLEKGILISLIIRRAWGLVLIQSALEHGINPRWWFFGRLESHQSPLNQCPKTMMQGETVILEENHLKIDIWKTLIAGLASIPGGTGRHHREKGPGTQLERAIIAGCQRKGQGADVNSRRGYDAGRTSASMCGRSCYAWCSEVSD